MTKPKRSSLLPKRYEDDLFVCDILDAVPKGDMASMEHPLFSLSTKPDHNTRHYENGDKWLEVIPSDTGLATVHDRDVLIYCISQCMAAYKEGREVSRHMEIDAYRLLEATNRASSGAGNDLLKSALDRLAGTRIKTNITQGDTERTDNFGMIDGYSIVSETKHKRIQKLTVTLSDFVFDAIEHNNVLTLHPEYFRLRKPIERRLYELARKHCGKQPKWTIYLDNLAKKAGSTSSAKEFKRMISKVITANSEQQYIPDYTFNLTGDLLTVRPIKVRKTDSSITTLPPLQSETYEAARSHAQGWDIRVLENDWRNWVADKKINVRHPDAAFIKFCRDKGHYQQEELF
jgi:plasmid replication initiation protein